MQNLSQKTDTQAVQTKRRAGKLQQLIREELGPLQPRILLLQALSGLLPPYVGSRVRLRLMQAFGLRIGAGCQVWGMPKLSGPGNILKRLSIGSHVLINVGCFFDLNDRIQIADHAAIGHEVLILTASHQLGQAEHRAADLITGPVQIGEGAWLGARATILPGISIGAGSVVAAGSVVTKDVPANTLVGGVPARPIRQLEGSS